MKRAICRKCYDENSKYCTHCTECSKIHITKKRVNKTRFCRNHQFLKKYLKEITQNEEKTREKSEFSTLKFKSFEKQNIQHIQSVNSKYEIIVDTNINDTQFESLFAINNAAFILCSIMDVKY